MMTALLVIAAYTGALSSWQSVLDGFDAGRWFITAVPFWLWVGVFGMVIVLTAFDHEGVSTRVSEKDSDGTEYEQLVDWLQDDREITTPEGDRFGHDEIAQRIARRLTDTHGESPTIAIVGPLGSGKSTILRLVEHHLKPHPSYQMLVISLWPFDSAEAAVAGILRSVIRSLGDHVNTLAVSGLSERYITTIEHVAGRWGILARYLRSESQPEDLLDSLSEIATAAGVKIVLGIEDMERFSGAGESTSDEIAFREAERLGPIQSLLYLLDRCDSISVIVADTSLRSRVDVGKIARFVEHTPRLEPEYEWRQIAILRSTCLKDDVIDPASEEYRKVLSPPKEGTPLDLWLWRILDTEPRIQEALGLLLNTPRNFKAALRLTWETWEHLRGEIDIDSVLVISSLRVSRPDVFALIDKHIDLFRRGFQEPMADRHEGRSEHPVRVKLDAMMKQEEDEHLGNAVKAVVEFVCPATFLKHAHEADHVKCPQGLCINRHVDYWQRYLALPDMPREESDQGALRAINAWRHFEENDLLKRMLDNKGASQIETFVGQFTTGELCRLLVEIVQSLREQSAAEWEHRSHAPGVKAVWRMMHERRPRSGKLADVLELLIREITPLHLPLVHDIVYFIASAGRNVSSLMDSEDRTSIHATLSDAFGASFPAGSSDRLLVAMREGSPYVVKWILGELAQQQIKNNHGQAKEKWEGIADVLLEAAEYSPEHGIAMVVPFVTDGYMNPGPMEIDETGKPTASQEYVAEFHEEVAKKLFDFDHLMQILANNDISEQLDGQIAVEINAAREYALAYMSRQEDQ